MRAVILLLLSIVIPVTIAQYKALIVAGSNGWDNYRHQADAFHAYSILIRNGMSAEDITLMAYNDIAYNELNPLPGIVINRPNGENVFPGNSSIDISGNDVKPETFLTELKKLSHSENNILIYFTDHGGPGMLCFPDSCLDVDDFKETVQSMNYKTLFFVVEACEAGSMFNDWLPTNSSMFVLSATNDREDSWACYEDNTLGTFLGDCFSVNFLQFLDNSDTYIETIGLLSMIVQNETISSPVTIYGDTVLASSLLQVYWGKYLGGVQEPTSVQELKLQKLTEQSHTRRSLSTHVPSWDVAHHIGLMRQHDSRFDYLRHKDQKERLQYNELTSYLLMITGLEFKSYKSPINSKCIKESIHILSTYGIKLSGYSQQFTKQIASICDFYSINDALKLVHSISKLYTFEDITRELTVSSG